MKKGERAENCVGGESEDAAHSRAAVPSPFGDDRQLVALLVADDNVAWSFCVGTMILPAIARSVKWREIAAKCGTPPEAVATMVYCRYKANDFERLRKFRFDAALSTWFNGAIRDVIRDLIRKHTTSQRCLREYAECMTDEERSGLWNLRPSAFLELQERFAEANERLAALWAEKPGHALVLLLRNTASLRAKEVAKILGFTAANVDQMNKRAIMRMNETRKALRTQSAQTC